MTHGAARLLLSRALRASLALLVSAFVAGAGLQEALLLCRTQQTTHHKCCCKHVALMDAEPSDSFKRPPCCDAQELASVAVPVSTSSLAFAHATPVRIERFGALLSPRIDERAPELLSRARVEHTPIEPTGPPIHIRVQSLLI